MTPQPQAAWKNYLVTFASELLEWDFESWLSAPDVMRMTRKNADRQPWLAQLLESKPAKIATVALANKTARIAWAVMSRKEVYAASVA